MACTASKSPGEAMGKPASITSTPRSLKGVGDLELFGEVHAGAGRLLAVAQRGVENQDSVRGWHASLQTKKAPGLLSPRAGVSHCRFTCRLRT